MDTQPVKQETEKEKGTSAEHVREDEINEEPLQLPVSRKWQYRGGSGGRAQGVYTPLPPLRFSNTTGIRQKKTMWFIGVEVEQEMSAPPPKKNPGSAPVVNPHQGPRQLFDFL